MKKNLFLLSHLLFVACITFGQKQNDQELKLDNGSVTRTISFKDGRLSTTSLLLTGFPMEYISGEGNEFSFMSDNVEINGKSGWKLLQIRKFAEGTGSVNAVELQGTAAANRGIHLEIDYVTYPGIPVIRKRILFENTGKGDLNINNLDIESLRIAWDNTYNVVYRDFARYKYIGPYTGNWYDAAIILHDSEADRGIFLGNETPGVIKRTTSCLDGRTFTIGLTHTDQDFQSGTWLSPGEKWESPWVFIALYNNKNPRAVVDGPVSEFVRNHMGIRLAQIPVKPTFVYNTWKPFRFDINDKMIRELADAAASCGVQEFVIDDGWQTNYGDWEIDYRKFPGGLKPVFDYIKSKGMKPGLWISMGAAAVDSKVYKAHPEWFVRDRDQQTDFLHSNDDSQKTGCFTTGWKDYIKGKILGLVREHGLEYVKLDFAIATSAYIFDKTVSGCYADDHPHKDHAESFLGIYRAAWKLYDELHAEAPDLFIDCTFETMGALQLIDYDMCKHAEGNWLSNFEAPAPDGSLRVRQMAWWRSPAMPASALVIGNQSMDDEMAMFSFKSLTGSLPIMLGDPRKLSELKKKEFSEYSGWMRRMQDQHNIMMYRQDLPGFGEPTEGQWDGFQRINTDTGSGGIAGVFRQNAAEEQRTVVINYLKPSAKYSVREAATGKLIVTATGDELKSKGFIVKLEKPVDAALFEVSLVK